MQSMRTIPAGRQQMGAPAFRSAVGRLSQCSLQGRIECAEKPGPVLLGQRSRSAGVRSEFAEVPRDLTTSKGVTYIRLRPLFAGRGDDARAFFETARCQRDIGGDAHVDGRDVLCNPVVRRVRAITDQDHSHVRGALRPYWSRTVGDDENIEPEARRHAVDFFPHRARISIDVDLCQLTARCLRTLAIPATSTTVSVPALP